MSVASGTCVAERAADRIAGLRLLMVADATSTHTQRWARHFQERGAAVTVLSPFEGAIEGVRVVAFPGARRWYHAIPKVRVLADYVPFRRLLREIAPQLVHFHFVSEGGRAFYWEGVDVPMVASTWGQDVIFDNGPHRGAEESLRRILERCRVITATTHQLAAATARYVPAGRAIRVIPFGVDLERFTPGKRGERNEVVLGFVKHLLPKYGPDVLVEAFALIHRARPNTRLVMAGRGTMREALERRVRELGLGEAVRFLGRVEHERVPELIRGFDLMVMPSIYESETFGVAAIEASACEVAVVASRVGGVPEAVIDATTGVLVRAGDAGALAEACVALIDNPERRRQLGEAGRQFVRRYYDWGENARRMEEVYGEVLSAESAEEDGG